MQSATENRMSEIKNTDKGHPVEWPLRQVIPVHDVNLLRFSRDTSGLLDNLHLQAFIVRDGSVCYSNSEPGAAEIQFTRMNEESPAANGIELCLRLCRSVVKTRVFESNGTGYMETGISFNGTPASLFVANAGYTGLSFAGYVNHACRAGGIKRVLIVDDNSNVLDIYSAMLEMLGYETFAFTDPHTAMSKMSLADFDLLITDYDMPGMNGFELCTKLSMTRPGLPVIIMSGSDHFPGKIRRSGCCKIPVSFMRKPFLYDNLCARLEVMEFFYTLEFYCRHFRNTL